MEPAIPIKNGLTEEHPIGSLHLDAQTGCCDEPGPMWALMAPPHSTPSLLLGPMGPIHFQVPHPSGQFLRWRTPAVPFLPLSALCAHLSNALQTWAADLGRSLQTQGCKLCAHRAVCAHRVSMRFGAYLVNARGCADQPLSAPRTYAMCKACTHRAVCGVRCAEFCTVRCAVCGILHGQVSGVRCARTVHSHV